MGLISNDLKNIADKLGSAKNSINAKYDLMRANNMDAPSAIEHLYINALPDSIDKIAVGSAPIVEESKRCDIVYVINAIGQDVMVQPINHGEPFNITHLEPSSEDGLVFLGWSDMATATESKYTAGQYVDDNLADQDGVYVLYAVWGKSTPPSPPPEENTAPSVPEITMVPAVELNTVKSGRNVSFVAQSVDADNDDVTYEWVIDGETASPSARTYGIGVHKAKCRALDSHGLYSDWSEELAFVVKNAPSVILRLEDPAAPPPVASGYAEPGAFNVYGEVVDSGEKLETTFMGTGFATQFQVYDEPGNVAKSGIVMDIAEVNYKDVAISRNTSYSEDTNYVTTVYTICNNASTNKYVSLCVHADIQIGKNDISWVDTGTLSKTNTGFLLRHHEKDYQFYVYTQDLPGLVAAHARWIGAFAGYKDHIWEESEDSIIEAADSAMAFSWQDIEVLPGETKTLTFILNVE